MLFSDNLDLALLTEGVSVSTAFGEKEPGKTPKTYFDNHPAGSCVSVFATWVSARLLLDNKLLLLLLLLPKTRMLMILDCCCYCC